jgi:hypothetical protein
MPEAERALVRGVPGAFPDDGNRLEIQTGRSTVVIFADSRAQVLQVAAALRPAGGPGSTGPLPQPDSGALEGSVPC